MDALSPGSLPNPFDGVELRTVGWQVIQGKMGLLLLTPLLVQASVMILGVVDDSDHPPSALGADRAQLLQKAPKRHPVEHTIFFLKQPAAITQTHGSEVAHALSPGIMPKHCVVIFPGHPHAAARAMLTKMHFVQGPQVYGGVLRPLLEFFLCSAWRCRSALPTAG